MFATPVEGAAGAIVRNGLRRHERPQRESALEPLQRIATLKTAVPAFATFNTRTLVYYRDLILVLLAKEFKVRYKSTFMGYAWSVMHPLVLALKLKRRLHPRNP
jgi:hypothetical protein